MLTSRPMNPRAFFPLAPCLIAFALAACATEAPTPLPEPVAEAETPLPEPIEEPAGPAPLAPVPPPPEQRPEAPPEVADPAIPRPQRIANFVDYAVRTHGVDADRVREVLRSEERRVGKEGGGGERGEERRISMGG